MRIHYYILTFLVFACCAMGGEEEKYTMRNVGLLVGKKFHETKPFLPRLVLLTKKFNARNTSRKFEHVAVSEIWRYGVDGSSLTLTFSNRQYNRAWKTAVPAEMPDDFILQRLTWSKFQDFPKEIGVWPFGLDAGCEPAEVITILGRPEITTLNENESGKLTFSAWSYAGKPFEFIFRNKILEEIAVIDSCAENDWKEYFITGKKN